ncbi:MAG: hypothetical protein LWW74_06810 [Burkholderiales bacterium]|nr:hypothetical protein [Burkholderiales bacterium]
MKHATAVLAVILLFGCGDSNRSAQPTPQAQPSVIDTAKIERQQKFDALKAEYKSANSAIKSCTDTLAKTGAGKLSDWGKSVKEKCSSLSDSDFSKAGLYASANRDGDIGYHEKTTLADILEAVKTGSRQPFLFDQPNADGEWLALNGNYQAQRNYAYMLRERGDYTGECAWRAVIIESGHKDAGDGDVSNLKFACGKLDQAQITLAQAKAKTLGLAIIENTN